MTRAGAPRLSAGRWADVGISRVSPLSLLDVTRPLFHPYGGILSPMAARPKLTKKTEFGNIWDENDPDGMLQQWGNRWIA